MWLEEEEREKHCPKGSVDGNESVTGIGTDTLPGSLVGKAPVKFIGLDGNRPVILRPVCTKLLPSVRLISFPFSLYILYSVYLLL